MSLSLSFFGAAGTVTGSRYLLDDGNRRVLVDCGLFQGHKELRERNWEPFPVDPSTIDTVLLTHAHIDHSGYLPALVRDGFSGRIYCSHASMELCQILLKDSAFLQEKDAANANRHGFSKHSPAKPLYTLKDAEAALTHFTPVLFRHRKDLGGGLAITLRHAGHILGAATIDCEWNGTRIVFSGDLGRFGDEVMLDPEMVEAADYLVVESTYGDRRHDPASPQDALAEIINRTTARGGTVVIPAFAVGRVQALLYHLERLFASGRLANVPVFLDSPMAVNASELLCTRLEDHRLPANACTRACDIAHYVRDVEESKALTHNPVPKIIISASGMATGGRVLHHLKRYAPERRNAVLFAGYQAAGTRGAAMVAGAESVKIHGEYVPVRAEVHNLSMLSAHADVDEILKWLGGFKSAPQRTFISHGEPEASQALRERIESELGWTCSVPKHLERVVLA
ncbi:MBL fold metallo-hydrolase RNA specificity domain-containing protein [Sinorhizobium sp. GL28]|uniref:MBL fold metallo-hydrolase RNA specificity domain-containing protein n=1 Tax=Sinorhizobium sp. GL28 TaxID=1358418 RepID=UPI00071C67C2|nr:MBL fold metallo-hydrolase [Sinorhizobium sp. GL28]